LKAAPTLKCCPINQALILATWLTQRPPIRGRTLKSG
jgi:hypothetical protein